MCPLHQQAGVTPGETWMTKVEAAALEVDPWGDGKGDDPYTVFRNVILVARKPCKCALCFGEIAAGDRVRAQTECGEGKVMTFRFCVECVRALGGYRLRDAWKPLEVRYTLGRERAERERRSEAQK
jgi:hypothetical protein